jgi:phosphate-selective porin OprO/OprP
MKLKTIIAGLFLATAALTAQADSTDDIVNALVGKGILTEEEGALIQKGRTGEKSSKDKQMTAKFKDGVTFSDANGDNSLSIGGRIHTDYRNFSHNQPDDVASIPTNSANETDTFDMRRARIEVKGKFAGAYDFLLSTDLAGASAGNTTSYLDQAYLNYTYTKPLQFRVGQFKMPMNLEKITSSNNTDFMERALVNQLAANEDRGIMVHGVLPGYTYAVAISNGEGAKNRNEADPRVEQVEYVGRGTVNFAEIMGDKNAVYHVGLSSSWTELSKGTANGYLSGTSSVRTEARGINIFTMPTITALNGVHNSIERTRVGLEGAAAYGPVKLQAEYIRNIFKGDLSTTTSFNNDINAWYAEALWLVTGETYADSYKEGAWSTIKPKNNFEFGKGTGAVEVGVRYSKFDASDWAGFSGLNMANNTLESDSWTAGAKWILNPNTKLMLNYVETKFDTPITVGTSQLDKEKAVMARAQWNF